MRIEASDPRALVDRARARARLASLALKVLLGAGSLTIVWLAAGVIIPYLTPPAPLDKVMPETPGQVSAKNPVITGTDKDEMPFTIKADKSTQDAGKKDIVQLDTFNGVFNRPAGKTYTVTSRSAQYDRATRQLDLQGDVEISDAPRMVAKMDGAHVDTVKRSLVSKSPVQVTLENGSVTADQLIADNNGERLLFKGRVKARFGATQ